MTDWTNYLKKQVVEKNQVCMWRDPCPTTGETEWMVVILQKPERRPVYMLIREGEDGTITRSDWHGGGFSKLSEALSDGFWVNQYDSMDELIDRSECPIVDSAS